MTVDEATKAESARRSSDGPSAWLLVVAVVSALVLGAVGGVLLLSPDSTPGNASAEAGFARDMSVHHSQAVNMAFMVYTRSITCAHSTRSKDASSSAMSITSIT